MKQVFYAEPMCEGSLPNGLYEVTRLIEQTGEHQKTAYRHLTEEDAKEKARELNDEYNK